jgi:hypothetical protein
MHDTGFLSAYTGHEEVSCELARQYLPEYGYDEESIEKVCDLIMTTRLPQSPFDKLSSILCDADLYYIGTDDYQVFANRLYRELKHQEDSLSNDTWLSQQKEFLKSHNYFTEAARIKLNSKKQANIKKLRREHFVQRVHNDYSLSDILLMLFGVATAGFALQGFLVPTIFLMVALQVFPC